MDGFRPVRFVKDHPVATVVLLAAGYSLAKYRMGGGFGIPMFRAKVSAGDDE